MVSLLSNCMVHCTPEYVLDALSAASVLLHIGEGAAWVFVALYCDAARIPAAVAVAWSSVKRALSNFSSTMTLLLLLQVFGVGLQQD